MDTLIPPAVRSHYDALISYSTDVCQRTLDAMHKLSELNLQLTRDMLADMGDTSQRMLASGNAAELGTALGNKLNPANAPLRDYQRKLADTMAQACDELVRATETHIPKLNRAATAIAEDTLRRASEETAKATERQQQTMEQMGAGIQGGNGHAGEQGEQRPH